jgi:hypothetical protein
MKWSIDSKARNIVGEAEKTKPVVEYGPRAVVCQLLLQSYVPMRSSHVTYRNMKKHKQELQSAQRTGCTALKSKINSRQAPEILLFNETSRHPPTSSVPGDVSQCIKRPGRESDHSPTPRAKVKNEWSPLPFTTDFMTRTGTNLPVQIKFFQGRS